MSVHRWLSRRDKAKGGQDKDFDEMHPAYHFHGLFKDDEDNASHKSSEKETETKMRAVKACLGDGRALAFNDTDVSYALGSSYAEGDATKAYELLELLNDSENGDVKKCELDVKLLGAVNRANVTCYLDATLFAMFARMESFEPILFKTFKDEEKGRLATLLRLWVNAVRTGKLVTTDITKQIQDTLAACGWKDAARIQQQDASEAFSFITEKLELPMLALKMHIFHTGKEDENDDHKIVNERLLEVAIPEEPAEGADPITLETCLEDYFNSRIEVKRFLERRATIGSVRSRRRSQDSNKALAFHVETAEVTDSQPSTPSTNLSSALPPYSHVCSNSLQHRSPSIIQEYSVLDEKALEGGFTPDCPSPIPAGRARARNMRKEVAMPAWQFFSLIPWYTEPSPTNPTPTSNAQVAAHFQSKRPVLGICLKRYLVQSDGTAVRRNTSVDVPTEIALPHFIADDDPDDGAIFGNFKMSLESVVCHRGNSVHQGHYVAMARSRDPTGAGQDTWYLFDDLAKDERVRTVPDIDEALKKESPYLLFYQILPIGGEGSVSGDDRPPSYSSEFQDTASPNTNGSPMENGFPVGRPSTESTASASEQGPRGRTIEWGEERALRERNNDSNGASHSSEYEAFTDAANGHLTAGPNPAVNAAATPPIAIPRRKGSKRNRNGRSPANGAVADPNRRLSASITRLTGMITGANRSDPTAVASGGDAAASLDPTAEAQPPSPPEENKKERKGRRGKSRDKSRGPKAKAKPKTGGDKPDRECVLM